MVAVAAASLIASCIHLGPSDGLVYVSGSTPNGSACSLSVVAIGSPSGGTERAVAGDFKEAFVVNPSSTGHRAKMICPRGAVAVRDFNYGKGISFGSVLRFNEASR